MKSLSFPMAGLAIALATLILPSGKVCAQHEGVREALMTRAEKTRYQETSHDEDVVRFVDALKANSPLVTVEQFGTTKLGNVQQLVIMANPRISSPEEARKSGKPVIYIEANIHAGEVEGKEASMEMMRDIAFGSRQYLLDNQIILFCPNYNPDGNDNFGENNRPSQEGSPKLVGVRASGEGLDLNREGMKAEAIEMKNLLKGVLLRWDPALFVDLHTDDGSWHGYMVNVAPSFETAGMPGPTNYTMDLLRDVMKSVQAKSGIPVFWHGYLRMRPGERPTFTAYDHLPRYLTNYVGLRNRMGILSETFPHELFEKRILSNYYLLVSILEYTGSHAKEINDLIADADRETVDLIKSAAGKIQRGVSYVMDTEPKPIRMLVRETESFTNENGRRRQRPTGNLNWIENVQQSNHFIPSKLSTVPRIYVFPAELVKIAEKLEQHGIKVNRTEKRLKVEGDEFRITKFNRSDREGYGGHNAETLEGEFHPVKKTIPAGSYFVDMAQPLAWLTFYLLEPQSDDGLVFWNYFDDYLTKAGVEKGKAVYPVLKVYTPLEGK